MRRLPPLLLVGVTTLLLAPAGASGRPTVPGVPAASITPVITATPGSNGWYTSNVTVNWTVEPPPLNSTGCDARTLVADTSGTPLTCSASFPGDVHITVTITIKIDKTAPTVSGAADRAPDANEWYNRPLAVQFSGADAMAGIAACSSIGYAGPDGSTASVSGTCRDNAGNLGSGAFSFKYDATPPTVGKPSVKAGKRSAELRWTTSPDTTLVELVRSPGVNGAAESVVYRGSAASRRDTGLTPGRKYRYTVTGYDQAANKAAQTIEFVGRGSLLNPAQGERISTAPLLVWTPVRGATYYNVVLVRGRRVFSAWPVRTRLQIPRSWVYRGQRKRLRPGLYRWYVWPGFGRLSAGRYGRMLGGSTFMVTG